jgi:hypothetical protein
MGTHLKSRQNGKQRGRHKPKRPRFSSSSPTPTKNCCTIPCNAPPDLTFSVHILNEVPGATAYAGMRTRALTTDLDGITLHIVGVDDLIRMKQTAGRPSDLEDIEAMTTVARREARRK